MRWMVCVALFFASAASFAVGFSTSCEVGGAFAAVKRQSPGCFAACPQACAPWSAAIQASARRPGHSPFHLLCAAQAEVACMLRPELSDECGSALNGTARFGFRFPSSALSFADLCLESGFAVAPVVDSVGARPLQGPPSPAGQPSPSRNRSSGRAGVAASRNGSSTCLGAPLTRLVGPSVGRCTAACPDACEAVSSLMHFYVTAGAALTGAFACGQQVALACLLSPERADACGAMVEHVSRLAVPMPPNQPELLAQCEEMASMSVLRPPLFLGPQHSSTYSLGGAVVAASPAAAAAPAALAALETASPASAAVGAPGGCRSGGLLEVFWRFSPACFQVCPGACSAMAEVLRSYLWHGAGSVTPALCAASEDLGCILMAENEEICAPLLEGAASFRLPIPESSEGLADLCSSPPSGRGMGAKSASGAGSLAFRPATSAPLPLECTRGAAGEAPHCSRLCPGVCGLESRMAQYRDASPPDRTGDLSYFCGIREDLACLLRPEHSWACAAVTDRMRTDGHSMPASQEELDQICGHRRRLFAAGDGAAEAAEGEPETEEEVAAASSEVVQDRLA